MQRRSSPAEGLLHPRSPVMQRGMCEAKQYVDKSSASKCLKKRNFKNKPTQLNSKTRPNTIEFDGFNYARLIDMHRFARNLKHVYTLAYDNNHMDGQPKVDGRDVAEVET